MVHRCLNCLHQLSGAIINADQLVEPRRMAISLDSDIRVEQVRTDCVVHSTHALGWQLAGCCGHVGSVKQRMLH